MKLGQRTLNNAVFNAGCGLVPLILSLVLWPYIVNRLGDAAYGIFALVGTVIGYFALLELGLGNAIVKYVAEYIGKEDTDQANDVIGVAMTVFLALGILGAAVILLIAHALATRWMKIPPDLTQAAFYSFAAASIGFFFTMLLTLLTAVVNGLNRYDISSLITAGMGALTTLGAAALLLMGYGLVHIVILNVVMPALAAGIYFRTGKRLFPQLKFRPRWRLDVFRQILGFGMYALLGRITDVIVRQVDLLIIGALLGVSSVTYYVIPFTILNRMTALVGRIGMVIFPAVSELQGQHQRDRIEALYLTSSRMILALATAFCVPLLICGPRFLYLWMNPEFAERGSLPMLLITAGVFFDLWTNVPTFVVDGMGRPKISGLAAVSQAAIFLALMVPMALWKGITGVAGAFLISMATVGPVFAWYVNHHIMAMTVRRLFHTSYLRPLAAGIITAVPLLLLPMERVTNIFVLLAILAAGFFGYFIVAFALGVFEQRERRVIGEYFQRAWRRMTKRGETP